jgi:hypothetical protein
MGPDVSKEITTSILGDEVTYTLKMGAVCP